ncbi:UNVERIFIED_CONTAM: hypothetical protein Sradi_3175800 [Sesamum radiatum]|uniref:Uncharacterized protein n=1 Tax=Sesamum radiatum TaxID=300843 RepID=A0AAW2RFD8_SESRA
MEENSLSSPTHITDTDSHAKTSDVNPKDESGGGDGSQVVEEAKEVEEKEGRRLAEPRLREKVLVTFNFEEFVLLASRVLDDGDVEFIYALNSLKLL